MSNRLDTFQATLIGVAGNAPAYGVGVATATLLAVTQTVAPLSVLICGLAMAGILISYQKLNAANPNCGAAYVWVGTILNPTAGFLAGWFLLVALQIFMVSATLAAAQLVVINLEVPQPTAKLVTYAVALALLLIVTIPSLYGANVFGRFQSALTILELILIVTIAGAAIVQNGAQIHQYIINATPQREALGAASLAQGIVIAAFFYWGWDVIFNLSEETKETSLTSARAGRYALIVLILIYTIFSSLAIAILKPNEIGSDGANMLFAIAKKSLPAPFDQLAAIAFLISIIGSLDASIIQFSRTLLSQSRDRLFSSKLAQVNQATGVPKIAILTGVAIAATLTTASYEFATINEMIASGVAGSAIFVAYYYGLAGIACATHFMRVGRMQPASLLQNVVWPTLSSLLLIASAISGVGAFGTLTTAFVLTALLSGLAIAYWHHRNQ